MEPTGDFKWTRDPSEGRGVVGRVSEMQDISNRLEAAKAKGETADADAIKNGTDRVVKAVTGFIEKIGGGAEAIVKFGDRLYRGAEKHVKVVVEDSWQVVRGLGEDTRDVLEGTAKGVLVGAKWAAMGTAIGMATAAAAPVVLLESAGVGLIELGQHGAKGLAEARAAVGRVVLHGIQSLAASIEAKALAGKELEKSRIEKIRDQHEDRVAAIREQNLGVQAYRAAKEFLNK